MADRIPKPLRRVIDTFGSFTPGQKAVTIAAILALAIGGYFFATWASKPSYAMLFNNLSSKDAAAVVESLQATGAPYELANGGQTILVPKDQVNNLRIQLSGEGLPAEADSGYALLDEQGITTSDFMQQVGYQRALEGELANTIKSIEGVEAATVHLVIPQKDVFSDDEKKPTASVLVASRGLDNLDGGQVKSIVHLVASSVEGLAPEDVTVAGSDGRILSAGGGAVVGGGDGDARSEQTTSFEQRMSTSLQKMLDSVVGPGHAVVQTTADLDFDQTETRTRTYSDDPSVRPLSESSKRETYNGAGGGNGGVLGPDNIQVPGNAAGGSGTYDATEETKNNAVGQTDEVRKSAPGSIRKLNVAVLLDSRTAGTVDPAQVQQLVTAAAGIDAARGDTIAVSAMPFDTSGADQARATAEAAAAEQRQAEQMSMAKTGGMAVLVLLLIFLAWRASRRARRSKLTAEEIAQLEAMQAALEAQRLAALEANTPAALEAATIDAEQQARDGRHREITQMVEQQPDEVAALLRGWLAERR
jgi:flagellar M-ring protein FliF